MGMDDGDAAVKIDLTDSVQQTFSLRYLNNFTKATGLSDKVILRMGTEVPLEVEYKIGDENFGNLRYYLAPKIDDDEDRVAVGGHVNGDNDDDDDCLRLFVSLIGA